MKRVNTAQYDYTIFFSLKRLYTYIDVENSQKTFTRVFHKAYFYILAFQVILLFEYIANFLSVSIYDIQGSLQKIFLRDQAKQERKIRNLRLSLGMIPGKWQNKRSCVPCHPTFPIDNNSLAVVHRGKSSLVRFRNQSDDTKLQDKPAQKKQRSQACILREACSPWSQPCIRANLFPVVYPCLTAALLPDPPSKGHERDSASSFSFSQAR